MNVAQVLQKKRDGHALADAEIEYIVSGNARGVIPDYQMAAFLAFVFLKGMDSRETQALTKAMMESGIGAPGEGARACISHPLL